MTDTSPTQTPEAVAASDETAPDYRVAMLYHSDRADKYMAEGDTLAADRDAQRERADAAEAELETSRLASGLVRMCVNCGKTRPADYGTSSPRAGCPSSDACTWDMTPQEAADHWRKVAHDRYEALAAEKAKVARLVEAMRQLIDHTHDCEKELTEELHHADFCGESLPLTNARAAIAEVQG